MWNAYLPVEWSPSVSAVCKLLMHCFYLSIKVLWHSPSHSLNVQQSGKKKKKIDLAVF